MNSKERKKSFGYLKASWEKDKEGCFGLLRLTPRYPCLLGDALQIQKKPSLGEDKEVTRKVAEGCEITSGVMNDGLALTPVFLQNFINSSDGNNNSMVITSFF